MRDYSFNIKFIGLISGYILIYLLATISEYLIKAKGIWSKRKDGKH